ncbi:MAG: ATP-binding protein [Lachnospiraceae bacterium]|nr:ATP-binding protein [Lachnospiraceae bacterium]
MGSKADFGKILLALMKSEYEQRQENQNRRRLKQACLPYTKTLEELDLSRYSGQFSELFVNELTTCQFIKEKRSLLDGDERAFQKCSISVH